MLRLWVYKLILQGNQTNDFLKEYKPNLHFAKSLFLLFLADSHVTATNNGPVVWILNHYAGSRIHGMEYRHYYLARHFRQMGLRPVIVCASFHHLQTKRPEGRRAEVDGIPYVWIKTCRYEGNGLGRVANMAGYSLRLACKRLKELPRPEVVIASSPHLFAALNGHRFAKRYKAKFIFEVRDLWPLSVQELGGYSSRHPFIRAMAWTQRFAYEHCDVTVSLCPGAKEYMVAHGLDEKKFVHIPNGFDLEAARRNVDDLPETHAGVIDRLKREGKRIVLYSGNHGIANALEHVVAAAELLKDETGIHFLLVGQGPEKPALEESAREAGLQNVTFLPSVTRSQMPALTREADLGYIGLQKKDLFKYGVSPNKLFEYMAAGLPVIFAIDTSYDKVSEARCGFSIPAEDPQALADVVRKIRQMPRDQLAEMGNRGRQYVQRMHTYKVLARQYVSLF